MLLLLPASQVSPGRKVCEQGSKGSNRHGQLSDAGHFRERMSAIELLEVLRVQICETLREIALATR